MSCKNCKRLRGLLSPKEDKALTSEWRAKYPRAALLKHVVDTRAGRVVKITAADAWCLAFKSTPSVRDAMRLGWTLRAEGWEPTVTTGTRYWVKSEEEV